MWYIYQDRLSIAFTTSWSLLILTFTTMQLRLFIYFFLLAATSVIAMHGRDDALEVLELKCEISVLHTYCPQSQPGTRLKRRMLGRRGPASVSDKLILLTGYERRKVMIQFDPSAAGTLPTTLKNYKLTSKEELENKVLSANRHRLILRPTLPVCATPELRTFLVGSYNKTTVNAVDADVINKPTARRSFSCIHILFVFCREIESRKRGVSFDLRHRWSEHGELVNPSLLDSLWDEEGKRIEEELRISYVLTVLRKTEEILHHFEWFCIPWQSLCASQNMLQNL